MYGSDDKGTPGSCSSARSIRAVLTVTEILKWIAIVASLYLSVWQYCVILGSYPVFVSGTSNQAGQFFGVFTGIIVGASLIVYLPWRILSIKMRSKYSCVGDQRWKSAILAYILLAATPSFVLILYAFENSTSQAEMDPVTVTVLQIVVLGLVLTEWMTKIQQEVFSFNLVTVMALDFFFAYDVIAFIMMSAATYVSRTGWIYPCFVFAVVSMFKYLPTQPIRFVDGHMSTGHLVCIITSMLCNDIPFIVIRVSTMVIFESFLISDMVFVVKNFFVIIFDLIQLGVMFHNWRKRRDEVDHSKLVPQERMFRGEKEIWGRIGEILAAKNKVAASEKGSQREGKREENGHVNEGVEAESVDSFN